MSSGTSASSSGGKETTALKNLVGESSVDTRDQTDELLTLAREIVRHLRYITEQDFSEEDI